MITRTLVAFGSMAAIVLAPGVVQGQTASSDLPRTPWGDPDLQGVWSNNGATPLERPTLFATAPSSRMKRWR